MKTIIATKFKPAGDNSTLEKKEEDQSENDVGDDADDEEEDVTEGQAEGKKKIESLSDLSDILYDKGTHFLMTHDTEVQLPELFFGGGSIKIEPKKYIEGDENEEEGALVKIVFKPPPPESKLVRGRVIHHLSEYLLVFPSLRYEPNSAICARSSRLFLFIYVFFEN
ncbi:hypothetical protein RUM44_001910 [Polyplax serrata]|uniref:Uncharacterized protein n=1 Tax=Polyplax serrata TaxID=468196 RepID=A0ABR1ALE6_POLSC